MYEKLVAYAAKQLELNADEITRDSTFESLGIDSLDIVEMIMDLESELGVELEIVDMDFDGIILAVQSGKGDFGAAGMTVKPEREEMVNFSIKYVKSSQYILVKADSDITATAERRAEETIATAERRAEEIVAAGPRG